MKTFILLTLAMVALSNAATHPKDFGKTLTDLSAPINKKCMQETGADASQIEMTRKGDFPDDPKFKKYLACLAINLGTLDPKTGEVNINRVHEVVPGHLKTDVAKIVFKCEKQNVHKELHDKAFEHFKCFYKNDPDNFIIF